MQYLKFTYIDAVTGISIAKQVDDADIIKST